MLKTLMLKTLMLVRRSWRWPALRRKTIKSSPCCAACGGTKKLAVHHIKPFHLFPKLELEPTNLIVLCEEKESNCHLRIGHGRDWDMWNPHVVQDAAILRANPLLRSTVWINARNAAIKTLSV